MALVAFLRGVNVGGNRRFRPAAFAQEFTGYDVVNIGATGLFVVRGRVAKDAFRRELLKRLPFETHVAICDARDVLELARTNPLASSQADDLVPFVSVLCEPARVLPAMPVLIPAKGEWYVQVVGRSGPFVFGFYRKHMKTISYLGKIDAALGAPATTRTWRTLETVVKVLQATGTACRRL